MTQWAKTPRTVVTKNDDGVGGLEMSIGPFVILVWPPRSQPDWGVKVYRLEPVSSGAVYLPRQPTRNAALDSALRWCLTEMDAWAADMREHVWVTARATYVPPGTPHWGMPTPTEVQQMKEAPPMIHADDYNRDPYGALIAALTGSPITTVSHLMRGAAHEAVLKCLHARFERAAKSGDVRDERRILDELAKLIGGQAQTPSTQSVPTDGLEIIIRGKKDRGKTTTAHIIKDELKKADYRDVEVSEDTPPHTEKDAFWERFQRTRTRPVRIRVETIK